MSKQTLVTFILFLGIAVLGSSLSSAEEKEGQQKPSPDVVMLKEGNERFAAGKSTRPHSGLDRLALAGKESQANHALATILSCSDFRVPVEYIFDVG